jgi:hypothetical protein
VRRTSSQSRCLPKTADREKYRGMPGQSGPSRRRQEHDVGKYGDA